MKPPKESRIRTRILTGEGPNEGEDIVEFVDSTTGEVVKREVRRNDSKITFSPSPEDPDNVEVVVADKPLSAQQMMRMAIREREQTFGKRVQELIAEIMEGCKAVILEGQYKHTVPAATGVSADIVKQAAKDLRSLGYKVKLEPDPESLATLTIGWPTKVKKKTVVVEEPAVEMIVPVPKKKKGRKRLEQEETPIAVPVPKARAVTEDKTDITFAGAKEKPPGWRPARRIPKPRTED